MGNEGKVHWGDLTNASYGSRFSFVICPDTHVFPFLARQLRWLMKQLPLSLLQNRYQCRWSSGATNHYSWVGMIRKDSSKCVSSAKRKQNYVGSGHPPWGPLWDPGQTLGSSNSAQLLSHLLLLFRSFFFLSLFFSFSPHCLCTVLPRGAACQHLKDLVTLAGWREISSVDRTVFERYQIRFNEIRPNESWDHHKTSIS